MRSASVIAQAVSRQLRTEAARVLLHIRLCGGGIMAGFPRVLWPSLLILIALTAPLSIIILYLYTVSTLTVLLNNKLKKER
jgi:hypothetical protein